MKSKSVSIAQWGQIQALYLPLYVAMEEGYFRRAGLDIDLILTGNDDAVFRSVARGEAQFGLGDPTFCAMGKGPVKAQIVSAVVERAGIWGITNNPVIHPVRTESDLVGLRIGCFPNPSTSFALISELKNNNKRLLRSMKIVEAQIGQQSDLLARDDADIALYIEPFISIAESRGWRVVYSFADLHGPYAFSGLYAGKAVIDNDPELVQCLVRAMAKGLEKLHSDPDIGISVLQKHFPELKSEIIRRAVKRCMRAGLWPESPLVNPESWKRAIRARQSVGDKFMNNTAAAINNDFAANI